MALEVRARRVKGPTGSSSAEVVAVRATATAAAAVPVVSDGSAPAWPTAETTGTSGTLTNSASDGMNTPGTYDSLNFTYNSSSFVIGGDNITFNNCRFNTVVYVNERTNTQFYDCEFTGGITLSSTVGTVIQRCKAVDWNSDYGTDDGIHITGDGPRFPTDVVIEDNYFYNANANVGAHADGMQVRGSLRLIVRHNYIDMGPAEYEHNAALYLEDATGSGNPTYGTNSNWLIEDNYFRSGYGNTLYISGAGGPGTFRNNTVAPAVAPQVGDSESTDYSGRTPTAYIYAPAPADVIAHGNVKEDGVTPLDVGGTAP